MTFKKLFPVAAAIAATSGIYIFIAQSLQITALWLPYISWTTYFLDGTKPSRLPNLAICLTGGMLIGLMTVLLIDPVTNILGPILSLPIIVFFMVLLILLLELIKGADSVPTYFFAYSSYFAFYYGKFGGESATPTGVLPQMWLLLMAGLGLGYFTAEARKKILQIQSIKEE